MKRATYKMIEDPNPIFGEIPEIPGVWANSKTLEACRDELEEVLDGWLILSLRKGYDIPVIDRINLNQRPARRRQVRNAIAVD